MNRTTRISDRQLRLVFDRSPLELELPSAQREAAIDRLSLLLQKVVMSELNSERMDHEREDHARAS
ncbi:MAG: hypothetical protein V3W34_11690 [Phycisphaerae bacterium]